MMIRRKPISLRACRRCGQATAKDTCHTCRQWAEQKHELPPETSQGIKPPAPVTLARVEWAERPMPKVWP